MYKKSIFPFKTKGFPKVAEMYGVKSGAVAAAINSAVEIGKGRVSSAVWNEILCYKGIRRITPAKLIQILIERFSNEEFN